jgi:hypothetical protein
MKFSSFIISSVFLISGTIAQQEGAMPPAAAAQGPANYSCDPQTCKLSNGCLCASKNPPNGLSPTDTPQFVTVTFDDSIQPQLYKTAKKMRNVTYVLYIFIYVYTFFFKKKKMI